MRTKKELLELANQRFPAYWDGMIRLSDETRKVSQGTFQLQIPPLFAEIPQLVGIELSAFEYRLASSNYFIRATFRQDGAEWTLAGTFKPNEQVRVQFSDLRIMWGTAEEELVTFFLENFLHEEKISIEAWPQLAAA